VKIQLKPDPCPFCGNTYDDEFAITGTDSAITGKPHKVFNFSCSCGAFGPDSDSKEEAVASWNKRK
jgi:hypothetical protein